MGITDRMIERARAGFATELKSASDAIGSALTVAFIALATALAALIAALMH